MYNKLKDLVDGVYPFHMPGHKRNPEFLKDCPDITEVSGADDLHHPEGLIATAETNAARFFGVRRTLFSTAGSTPLILAAISAATKLGDKILIARNCHRSVYNAALINSLEADFVIPDRVKELDTDGAVSPDAVRKSLSQSPAAALVITSPTYDGFVSNIDEISRICHESGALLIVDAAHGAHLGLSKYFLSSARSLGADLVIESAHKTLPCLTGAAFLHICTDKVDPVRLQNFFSVYHTSSPSYPIIASIESTISLLKYRGETLFRLQSDRLDNLYRETEHLRSFNVVRRVDLDKSKILISCKNSSITGFELKKLLLRDYKIECEMAMPNYLLALSSLADTSLGFDKLSYALTCLDREIPAKTNVSEAISPALPLVKMAMRDAFESDTVAVPFEFSAGGISADFVYAYPPGSPIIAPGELITPKALALCKEFRESGAEIHITSGDNSLIRTVQEV